MNKLDPELNRGSNQYFSNFIGKDSLQSYVIFGILEDDNGILWLSTDSGLLKYNPRGIYYPPFKSYNMRDGLQGYKFNMNAYYKSRKGEMFFGGFNGLNAFYPQSINSHVPAITITDFKLFNLPVNTKTDNSPLRKHISETEKIVLTYQQNVFSFEFAALHFPEPERNKYAYIMEGFDKNWIYTDATDVMQHIRILIPVNIFSELKVQTVMVSGMKKVHQLT